MTSSPLLQGLIRRIFAPHTGYTATAASVTYYAAEGQAVMDAVGQKTLNGPGFYQVTGLDHLLQCLDLFYQVDATISYLRLQTQVSGAALTLVRTTACGAIKPFLNHVLDHVAKEAINPKRHFAANRYRPSFELHVRASCCAAHVAP